MGFFTYFFFSTGGSLHTWKPSMHQAKHQRPGPSATRSSSCITWPTTGASMTSRRRWTSAAAATVPNRRNTIFNPKHSVRIATRLNKHTLDARISVTMWAAGYQATCRPISKLFFRPLNSLARVAGWIETRLQRMYRAWICYLFIFDWEWDTVFLG